MEADHIYFARRAEEERAAAEGAITQEARTILLELAGRYARLAAALDQHRIKDIE